MMLGLDEVGRELVLGLELDEVGWEVVLELVVLELELDECGWEVVLAMEEVRWCDPHSCTAVRVPAYVRFGVRTIRAIRFMTCLSLCLSVS